MCRSTDYHGFQSNGRERRLSIRAFFVRFSGLDTARKPLPDSATLLYLPRINEQALDVNGASVRPDSPAFVTLHRVVKARAKEGEAVFGSREPVRAGEGVRFEVYLREERVVKGIFRKDEGQKWKLECKCAVESESGSEADVAEVYVAVEGHVAMSERVDMLVRRRKMENRRRGCGRLEEIPEAREEGSESDEYCCCCGGEGAEDGESGSDGGDLQDEMDMEGVRWAVDLGIWVMCLGVGLLVSKASLKRLKGRKIL
ncbi:uncharacterized protein LOC132176159 [Corylus avellana]|uniref:uncharacterized protein LOC132176159 n=1 Tax=Corylus avellana TaxID=13451 RepID=UPI001E1F3B12|nr:uncharacterized protein LOC132176159 [Corylus avellana]